MSSVSMIIVTVIRYPEGHQTMIALKYLLKSVSSFKLKNFEIQPVKPPEGTILEQIILTVDKRVALDLNTRTQSNSEIWHEAQCYRLLDQNVVVFCYRSRNFIRTPILYISEANITPV